MGGLRKITRTSAGYTLVELMMIVTIIGLSVTLFAPGFGRAMADRRITNQARELVRLGRRARSDTFGYLRAHLLWIQPSVGDPAMARVQLLRAPTNSCLLTTWEPIRADCDRAVRGQRCVEDVRLTGSQPAGPHTAMREESLNASGAAVYSTQPRALCFGPNGVTYYGSGANITAATSALSEENTEAIRGGFVFTLHAGSGNPGAGDRVHRVLFPLGSSPRALR